MPNKILKLLIFLICFIFFLTCSISQEKEYTLYRFIDHLDKKNIISSPFVELNQKFKKIKQKWSGKELKSITMNKKYFSISTQVPVLGWEDQGKPEMMKISVKGKEIPFQEDSSPNVFSWKLKKGEVEIEEFNKNGQRTKVLLLNEKESLEEQIILPDGEFVLEIWAESKNPQTHFSGLKIDLNNEPIGEIIIGPYKCYKLIGQARSGWNKLVFFYEKSIRLKEQSERGLYIDKISVKSLKDFILFTIPENKEHYLTAEFSAEYLAEPIDEIFEIKKNIESSQSYIREIEFDSSGKKRIEIIGYSPYLNSVLNVKLNDQKIYEEKVTTIYQGIFLTEKWIEKGKHNLELEYRSPPREKGNFYLSAIIIKNPKREIYLPLAKIKNVAFISDLAIGSNSLGLKKKLVIPNFSWQRSIFIPDNAINTIFAPPRTYLEFELKISQSGVLEFGYGLLEKSWKEKGNGVNFKIIIQEKRKGEVIFSKHLNPYQIKSHRKLFQKRIDLSPYYNKKVKLKFVTTTPSFEKESLANKSQASKEFAFWYNPVIYQRTDDRGQRADGRVNVILISIDTLRADHLGCYGYKRETSPNIDRLTSEGVVFTNAFSTTSWTLPAHISLLTSLDTRHHQVNKANPYLDNSIVTLADILRKNGYFTYGFTGGALVSQRFGFSKGFDFYREFKGSQSIRKSAEVLYNNFDKWLEKNKDKKFFLFLHTYQTHEPYYSPSPFNSLFFNNKKAKWEKADMRKILFNNEPRQRKRFNNVTSLEKENIIALYDGEIRYTDECLIKPLIEKLKKFHLYQNTMIILTSDHGEEFFDHRAWLHGHSLYNELIKIPLIVKFPFSKFKNLKLDKFVRIIDIMPTILEEAGIDYSSYELDGLSLISIIKNNEKEERIFIADVGAEGNPFGLPSRIAVNFNRFKLILNNDFGKPPEYFFPCPPPIAKAEFYDLKNDPVEKKNIVHQEKGMVQDLLKKIYKIYQLRPKKGQKKSKVLDKELEETLKALGYIR
ncbi:MAG: sulfatase [Candidatus Aminicenantia bacterium]